MKVSIVIPVRDGGGRLREAIASVLAQDHKDIEVLVVDDGSKEDIHAVVEGFRDGRLSYFRREAANANAARNYGIGRAQGDYIAMLDADDLWTPDHLSGCLARMTASRADGLYSSVVVRDNTTGSERVAVAALPAAGESMAGYLLRTGYGAQTSGLFMTAASARAIPWDEDLLRHQDYDFVVRYARRFRWAVKPNATVIHNAGHKRPRIHFPSCIRFIEQNRADIAPAVLKSYACGMLRAAVLLGAEAEVVEYYARLVAGGGAISPAVGEEINLFLMDIENGIASGVVSYMAALEKALESYPFIRVHRVRFLLNAVDTFVRDHGGGRYTVGYTPATSGMLTDHRAAMYYLLQGMFAGKKNVVLHIHTLDLIDLAVYIRERTGCKIVTHLHCVPWRGLINTDKASFDRLYNLWHNCGRRDRDLFTLKPCERLAYEASDALVCVTENGRDFLRQIGVRAAESLEVIYNGLPDVAGLAPQDKASRRHDAWRLLFVGGASEGKGLLHALHIAAAVAGQGHALRLVLAGHGFTPEVERAIRAAYPLLDIEVAGMLSAGELDGRYRAADIGIVPSLQEQCSYAAIEMARRGLPIVAARVDGLAEMFTDRVNAILVPVVFTPGKGLGLDEPAAADAIIEIMKDGELRRRLSEGARSLYEERFTAEAMAARTVKVYRKIIE